ncbi:MAG: hypothetical protein V4604_04040 [Bacteroidota bacterium]
MKGCLKIFALLFLLASCEQKTPPAKRITPNGKERPAAEKLQNPVAPKDHVPTTIYSPPSIANPASEKVAYHPHGDSVLGIWKVTKDSYHEGMDGENHWVLGVYPGIFNYDGTYITTAYFCLWRHTIPKWVREDGYYKLRSKWSGDTLAYLTPLGDWNNVGVFRNGLFASTSVVNDSSYVIHFEKIVRSEVPDYEKVIFNPRKPHNYALK